MVQTRFALILYHACPGVEKRDLKEGRTVISSNMTVEAWAYKVVETYKTRQKEVTRKTYISRIRHCILEEIGWAIQIYR